ncbi:MAG TPA: thioredoxin domain-containing protein, partial [Polyangiaceae bacterium]|nr:thioredoxin domain-containing protein [Polyangiaceae bacterium]
GPWTDVYGLARVASELLAGRRAAIGGAPPSSATGDPAIPSPRALGALVPDRVEAMLRRALAPSAAARPEDVREIIALLREAASDPLPAPPPPSTGRPSFPEPRLSSPSFNNLPAPNASAPPAAAPAPAPPHTPPPFTPLLPYAPPPRDRGLAWAIGLGGALVAVTLLGGGIFFWLNDPSTPLVSPLASTSASAPPYAPSPPGDPSAPPSVSRFAPMGAASAAINASDASALVPLFGDDASRGAAKAPATLVIFGDLTCRFTAQTLALIPKLEAHYGNNLRVVFKHYPLPEHAHAREAAEAAAAVRARGGNEAFWKFVEGTMRNPEALDPGRLEELGLKAGMPAGVVSEALRQHPEAAAIERDVRLARRLGLRGTPTLFLNGRRLDGHQPYAALTSWVDDEQQRALQTQRDSPLGDRLYAARVFANITSAEGERRAPD